MPELPKKKKIRLPDTAYKQGHAFSITITTYERYPWFQFHKDLPDKLIQFLLDLAVERKTLVFAWCLMPDHLHLLLEDNNLIDVIRLLKVRLTPEARRIEKGRPLWQRSFYDHALRREESLERVARYIWENPVRAGLVEQASDYPWSGSSIWSNWREIVD